MSPDVTAIVVAWRSAAALPGLLDDLQAQRGVELEVVVVDNASPEHDGDVAAAHSGVVVLRASRNLGFCGGANLALSAGTAPHVLLVNPDVRLADDHVARLLAVLRADPALGSAQGRLRRMDPGRDGASVLDSTGHVANVARLVDNRDEGRPDPPGRDPSPAAVWGATGACVLHRRAMLDDVALPVPGGGREWLDGALFAYHDDVDLDWRAARRGWRAAHVHGALGWHERGGAGPRRTAFVEELSFANRILVVAALDDHVELLRHAPTVLLTTSLKLLELAITHPRAALRACVRVREGWAHARERRRLIDARATRSAAAVAREFSDFSWRRWIGTWWRRTRGRSAARPGG